jgi:hypothetical protein
MDNIPFTLTATELAEKIRIKDKERFLGEAEKLVESARQVARPKAVYTLMYIREKGDDWVCTGDVEFRSRVLRVNLDQVHRFFPFVATCGTELDEWATSFTGLYERFCADAVCELALRSAVGVLVRELSSRFKIGHSAMMNPGSLPDWPLEEQKKLFHLLGDPRQTIGVTLTDSCLMLPVKSLSGIRFATESDYENCMLCPRGDCPGRKAPYDPEMVSKYK